VEPTEEPSPSPAEASAADTPSPTPTGQAYVAVAGATSDPEDPWAGNDGAGLEIGDLPSGGAVSLDGRASDRVGMFSWAVPFLFLGLPALLLILIVVSQAGFAWVFVPLTNRTLGSSRRRRNRSR
jgi:hypothetical protein